MTHNRSIGYLRPGLELLEPAERTAYLDGKVEEIVAYAYENTAAFKARMDGAGLKPRDVDSVKDLARVPVIGKADLVRYQRENLPFGGLIGKPAVGFRRIYISPGPIYEPGEENYTDDRWAQALHACGFRSGDIAQVTFNFNMVPFAFWLDESLRQLGCRSIPAGVGNTELQVQILKELQVDGYLGTPSFLAALADKAVEMGLDTRRDFNLKSGFVAAEMLPESLRTDLEDRFGMVIRQSYGTADVGCLSYECRHMGGMHLAQDCVVEVVDPQTGKPVKEGEVGEVVATIFDKAYPLIRFGTGDLSSLSCGTCECGRTSPKLTRIMGRVDQMTKVKGMFIHPSGVKQVADRFPEVAAYQLVVERKGHKDVMVMVCELADPSGAGEELKSRMSQAMKDVLRVSGEVSLVEKGSLPAGCKVIDDRRVWK